MFLPCLAVAASGPGLHVAVHQEARSDAFVTENIRLYRDASHRPTPFLQASGPCRWVWRGNLSVELRGDFRFQAHAHGTFELLINGSRVLQHTGMGDASPVSQPVRLNKGPNTILARLNSDAAGKASVRLLWAEDDGDLMPIPDNAFHHDVPPPGNPLLLREGRALALEYRCFRCHEVSADKPRPELSMDAPVFAGIGSRLRFDWMRRWILDPHAQRQNARMPRLLHGTTAEADATAIAAFLSTLEETKPLTFDDQSPAIAAFANLPESSADVALFDPNAPLAEQLLCHACHSLTEPDPAASEKMSLRHVRAKFKEGRLAEYLRRPEAHYAWTSMPNFHLNQAEASELAGWLLDQTTDASFPGAPRDSAVLKRGRDLVQSTGCLNCHALDLPNAFKKAAPFSAQLFDSGTGDCLGGRFRFTAAQRKALRHFAVQDGWTSLNHIEPVEFVTHQVKVLGCTQCHGRFEGFPGIDYLGGKLKPEFMAKILAGKLPYKPRPWLPHRMPAFPARARHLAHGLAMHNGFPPVTPEPSSRNPDLSRVGGVLLGKEDGFSCVSCHAVGDKKAEEVFEAEGINFIHTTDRLQKDYFRLWLLNPTFFDPRTKMPRYFENARSLLEEPLDGDAEAQINALWHFLLENAGK